METVEDKRGVGRIGEINGSRIGRGEAPLTVPKRRSEQDRINRMLEDAAERQEAIIIKNLLIPAGWPEIVANALEGQPEDDWEDLLCDLKARCDDDMIPCPSAEMLFKMSPALLHLVA